MKLVSMFINRIENETPSGYAPNFLIITVSRAHPNPKTVLPRFVVGVVT